MDASGRSDVGRARHRLQAARQRRIGTDLAQQLGMKLSSFSLSLLFLLSLASAGCLEEDPALLDGPVPMDPGNFTSVQQAIDLGWYYIHLIGAYDGGATQQQGVFFEAHNDFKNERGRTRAYATIMYGQAPILITGLLLTVCEDGSNPAYSWQEILSNDHNHDTSPELGFHYPQCPPGVYVAESAFLINFQR